jgi:7-cyano-7-deazaguanine synthase
MALDSSAALVLFSGGQDSATCLAWALNRFERVETVAFDYDQRHRVELDVRQEFLEALRDGFPDWGTRLGADHMIDAKGLAGIGQTAMTQDVAIEMGANGLPTTFVPGRNILFLTYAAAVAYRRGLRHIITGVCETDFSGYPDCRDDTIKAVQVALNLGMESRFVLQTPLMWRDKARTWALADDLGGPALLSMVVNKTHTCYIGDRTTLHPWGYGCGECPACNLRANGWWQWQEGA